MGHCMMVSRGDKGLICCWASSEETGTNRLAITKPNSATDAIVLKYVNGTYSTRERDPEDKASDHFDFRNIPFRVRRNSP